MRRACGSTGFGPKLPRLARLSSGLFGGPTGFDARAAFRAGFLAAAFAVFLAAGFLEALRALVGAAFVFVDRFLVVELFFFGRRLRLPCRSASLLHQLQPQRALQSRCRRPARPVLSQPRRQPPHHQGCYQPCLCLYQCAPILIFVVHVSLPELRETTLALVSLAVNKRLFVMHCRETCLRTVARRLRGSIAKTCNPLLRCLARLWQANDVRRPTLTSDVLRWLTVTSIEQCVCSGHSRRWCRLWDWSLSTRAFQLPRLCVLGQVPSPRRLPWVFLQDCRSGLFQMAYCYLLVLNC